jgi:hypothetical protein
VRDIKASVPDAPKILQGNVYGWFAREARGVYALTDSGRAALDGWSAAPPTDVPSGVVGQPGRADRVLLDRKGRVDRPGQ